MRFWQTFCENSISKYALVFFSLSPCYLKAINIFPPSIENLIGNWWTAATSKYRMASNYNEAFVLLSIWLHCNFHLSNQHSQFVLKVTWSRQSFPQQWPVIAIKLTFDKRHKNPHVTRCELEIITSREVFFKCFMFFNLQRKFCHWKPREGKKFSSINKTGKFDSR